MNETNRAKKPMGINVLRSSVIMGAGTMVSRILGFARQALVLYAVGAAGGGAVDAWLVANSLPNQIYNLLAAGIISAILVPQIVRAVRNGNSDEFVNRLITMAGAILLIVTLISLAGASILISIFANQMDPQWRAMAVIFAIWCLPQILFYGLYSLYGQVLNASGSFGPYMWAPVLNNIIGIAGLLVLIWVFGPASASNAAVSDWTFTRTAILAGSATFGVICQALILLIPLRKAGFKLRFKFGFRNSGLKKSTQIAGWAFAGLVVGQIGFLIVSNMAAAASGIATSTGELMATTVHRNTAFMIYMVPQSVINTSILTAMFTKISNLAAQGDLDAVRTAYGRTLRVLGTSSIFFSAFLIVCAVPVTQLLLPSRSLEVISPYATTLALMAPALIFLGMWTSTQQVFFAFEKAKYVFFIQVSIPIVTALSAGFTLLVAPPRWWVPMMGFGEALSWGSCFLIGFLILNRHLPGSDFVGLFTTLAKAMSAAGVAALTGWSLLHLWGLGTETGTALRLAGAVARCMVAGGVMLVVFLATASLLQMPEVRTLRNLVLRKLGRGTIKKNTSADISALDGHSKGRSGDGN